MSRKYLALFCGLLLAGCSQSGTPDAEQAPGGQTAGAEANANVTLVSLSVPGMT